MRAYPAVISQANGPEPLLTGILSTQDNQVQVVMLGTAYLNTVQVAILVSEGIFLVAMIACYIWFVTSEVGKQRYNM